MQCCLGRIAGCKAGLARTYRPASVSRFLRMQRTPSKAMAALWMGGWLALMLMVTVAGREALREIGVFQLILIRAGVGLLLLYPLIHRAGGFPVLRTQRLPLHIARNSIHFGAQLAWFFALTLIPIGQ